MPKQKKVKLTDEQESAIAGAEIPTPQAGDVIQVTARPHSHTAWIGIVHSIDGELMDCYQPDGVNPRRFKVELGAVEVVGKARLKWPGPLPEKSKDYNKLDKV